MLIESITLAQRDNKELEALIYRFRPLIRKCGRQLHIEDGEQEMVVAFIELIKRFRPERLRSQDDGKVVQYIKNAMNPLFEGKAVRGPSLHCQGFLRYT